MKLRKHDNHEGGDMHNNERAINNEQRIVKLETINENINSTLQRLEKKIDSLDNRIWANFLWVMSAFAGLFAIIAHALHWF